MHDPTLNQLSVEKKKEKKNCCAVEAMVSLNPDGSVTIRNTYDNESVGGQPQVLKIAYNTLRPIHVPFKKIYMRLYDAAVEEDPRINGICQAVKNACQELLDNMRRTDGSYRTYAEMIRDGRRPSVVFYHEEII